LKPFTSGRLISFRVDWLLKGEPHLRNTKVWMEVAFAGAVVVLSASSIRAGQDAVTARLKALPLPPPIENLIGFPAPSQGRTVLLALIAHHAARAGLPPRIAEAVTAVESGFAPGAVGGVGEVGLMQVRPQTALLLGYMGPVTGLFDPETNVRLGVEYLAQAWRLAGGDLCRTLMKYRAGHGEERMSALSVEYCRRAREQLAAMGSPLAQGTAPAIDWPVGRAAVLLKKGKTARPAAITFEREVTLARTQVRSRRGTRTPADSQLFWAAHELESANSCTDKAASKHRRGDWASVTHDWGWRYIQ
jgi:Transglycosylase SLT domain